MILVVNDITISKQQKGLKCLYRYRDHFSFKQVKHIVTFLESMPQRIYNIHIALFSFFAQYTRKKWSLFMAQTQIMHDLITIMLCICCRFHFQARDAYCSLQRNRRKSHGICNDYIQFLITSSFPAYTEVVYTSIYQILPATSTWLWHYELCISKTHLKKSIKQLGERVFSLWSIVNN